MTKKLKFPIGILTVLVVFLAAVLLLPVVATDCFAVLASTETTTITPTKPTVGDGTSGTPYEISNVAELYWFAALVNGDSTVCDYNAETNPEGTQQNTAACAKLTANITVNNGVLDSDGDLIVGSYTSWTPIGNSSYPYTGTFDGAGMTISGLYFNDETVSCVGLFGYIGNGGKVSNVGVIDSYFNGKYNVGGVCGKNDIGTIEYCYNTGAISGRLDDGGVCGSNESGTIENCYNEGAVSSLYDDIGGVCGFNTGTIKNCHNTGAISGRSYLGGVCGYDNYGTIENCYNTGEVSGTGDVNRKSKSVGGVCGYNLATCTIKNCYNTGAVSGTDEEVGGVCGKAQGKIINCYNTGTVSGSSSVGGVSGYSTNNIINCYNTGAVSGSSQVGGVSGYKKTIANCYYLAGCNAAGTVFDCNEGTSKTATQFGSGEVAYLLSKGCTLNSTTYSGEVWGQTLTGATPDKSPTIGGTPVYPCTKGCTGKYGNTTDATGEHTAPDTYDNGFGTCKDCQAEVIQPAELKNGVYEIGNAGQLYWFAQQVNSGNKGINAELTADITINTGVLKPDGTLADDTSGFRSWTPIGNESYQYGDTFNGNNHTVSGLFFNEETADYVGLFGYIGRYTISKYGKVSNVGVVDSCFRGHKNVGGVCGYNYGGTIEKCYNTGAVSGTGDNVGGVCGYKTLSGAIKNCYNTGTVSGTSYYVGGVCGYSDSNGSIENCYNTGAVSGTGNYVGGVCGYGASINSIKNCYYLDGTTGDSNATSKIEKQFASGEVAALLQGTQSEAIWGQNIDNGDEKQYFPVLGGATVYQSTPCKGLYSNTSGAKKEHAIVSGENGFDSCNNCGEEVYQPAKFNEAQNYYEISNAGQLYWFAALVNGTLTDGTEQKTDANAILTADITVNKDVLDANGELNSGDFRSWTPIGNDDNQYTGTFDGQGYTVSGLYFNQTNVNEAGLFVNSQGTIQNVGVVNSYFYSGRYVGGVCAFNEGTITNCYNTGTVIVVSSPIDVGGVCGRNSGTIENCYNTGKVSGRGDYSNSVGGVCGYNIGTIKNCYNTGSVNCTKTDTVNFSPYVGGVCGWHFNGSITNCYNTGAVSGVGEYVGGVCGKVDNNRTPTNCYYLVGTATGGIGTNNDTSDNVESKTTVQFASGEVAYLLQSGQTADENGTIPEVWGQDLSAEISYPVLGGAKVYQTTPCVSYTNSENTAKEHTDADSDNSCDSCREQYKYMVETVSSTADGTAFSVAKLDGGGNIKNGESTTITASAVPGYTFNGWYNGETLLSADLSFEYTPTEDVTLTAKYTANAKMTVNINGGMSYSISVNGGTASDYSTNTSPSYEVGTKLTVTAKGENFAYWQNEAGSVLSRSEEYTFTVVNGATVTAVYNTPVANKAIVNFISGYDQIINRYQITATDTFTVPYDPIKTGCDFAGWSINGTVVALTADDYNAAVKTAVQKAISDVLATADTTDDIINVKATYTDKVQSVTVTVTNGTGTGTYNINAVVTVTANASESGYKFSYWTDDNGTILSYNTSYSFYAAKDIALTAVYVEEAVEVEAVGTTEIVDSWKDTEIGRITFVSMSTVPEDCTIVKAGVIATSDSTVGTSGDGFNDITATYVRGGTPTAKAYRYTWYKSNVTAGQTWYVRAYLVYTDKNGNTHTIYGAVVSETL